MMQRNKPSKKKVSYKVNDSFHEYLSDQKKIVTLPLSYDDLLRYDESIPLLSVDGTDTLWRTVFFSQLEQVEISRSLCQIYSLLNADGDQAVLDHLSVSRIDYCTFGNSNPFRIRIINELNDNYDHFYVKKADASRIYGLELEILTSPNILRFRIDEDTLIEEHVAGIPGDEFIKHNLDVPVFDQIRIAKEFVKFNERCFVRLLGDMRSYNFIVDITPDIEGNQYRIRSIDFDQQSYEGRKSFYLPQYFKENNPIIHMGMQHMESETVRQYQLEERSLIARRINNNMSRVDRLIKIMVKDKISSNDKVEMLKQDLKRHHKSENFDSCQTMGELLLVNLQLLLAKDFKQSIISF